jgi:hypothetical protein
MHLFKKSSTAKPQQPITIFDTQPKKISTTTQSVSHPEIIKNIDNTFDASFMMERLKNANKQIVQSNNTSSEHLGEVKDKTIKSPDATLNNRPKNQKTLNKPTTNILKPPILKPPILKPPILKPKIVIEPVNTVEPNTVYYDKPAVNLPVPKYFMNNREKYINSVNQLLAPYKKDLDEMADNITCESLNQKNVDFEPLVHQLIVREYMNYYTPYHGALLLHGLGSGKTCTSIGIAEGMKDHKQIVVMTPASLRTNYMGELKKCGDALYKKQQHWKWISTVKHPEQLNHLATTLGLDKDYIVKKKGGWLVDPQQKSNYMELSDNQQKKLDAQIDMMIANKYYFIHYNGLTKERLVEITQQFTINPFDNKVIIIDEAHNLISRIVNKIAKKKSGVTTGLDLSKESIPIVLYELLLSSKNSRVITLTGTPVVNYPNELGILFNILRGYIKTWTFQLNSATTATEGEILKILYSNKSIDYNQYESSTKRLVITKNPFGFINADRTESGEYDGMVKTTEVEISDDEFASNISKTLAAQGVNVVSKTVVFNKLLPDTTDTFNAEYINPLTGQLVNTESLKRRIMGLTSFFKSAQENLLPKYDQNPDTDYHVEKIPMSNKQFGIYKLYRQAERKSEKPSKNNEDEISSTYRIFSRLFCNFVMNDRPMPDAKFKLSDLDTESNEDAGKVVANMLKKARKKEETVLDNDTIAEGVEEGDNILMKVGGVQYKKRIEDALLTIATQDNGDFYLSKQGLGTYSPKFLRMLENIQNPNNEGLHLIYSQFRTMEGIGIFSLVLEHHGFARFKVKKSSGGVWSLNIANEDMHKPKYIMYTGTENADERELLRNIYNADWDQVPSNVSDEIFQLFGNSNLMGEIVKVIMITSSGSEGISLKATRFVHLMEYYWHPSRAEQVIGRARRICSHAKLSKELQTVEVFVYLMEFTKEQMNPENAGEIIQKDLSKINQKPITSDEYLYEISEIKKNIVSQILTTIQESSFDCYVHNGDNCLNFANPSGNKFAYVPDYAKQEKVRQEIITWRGIPITNNGVEYIGRKLSHTSYQIFDKASYLKVVQLKKGSPLQVGTYDIINGKDKFILF